MPQNSSTYIIGDVRDCLAAIPDGSIDLVMTSPPFLALRSYLPADHPDKHREIGSEPDPATFLDTLLLLTAEWGRVLAPHGSICVELGDTYSGASAEGSDQKGSTRYPNGRGRAGLGDSTSKRGNGWPLPKSLCGIPHLYHLSLAYGRNLLTGEESPAGRWRVRNVVAWCRPNPPVGALGDKFRPATSYMTIATRAQKRYFDLDAVRVPLVKPEAKFVRENENYDSTSNRGPLGPYDASKSAGAPPLDYWVIPTQPYSGSHYATFPASLCERPIKAMCPAKVCTVCGAPSERITERSPEYAAAREQIGDMTTHKTGTRLGVGRTGDSRSELTKAAGRDITCAENVTIGWTECECPDDGTKWRPGVVLDPFAGSGTTLMVATGQGRDAIGIDIDSRNADLALDRVGPLLLTVEHLSDEVAS